MSRLPTASRRLAAAGAALLLAGCTSTTEILQVTDPDIINPSDVTSAAGANAVRLGALARLNAATTGDEGMFQLGGLLADEWRSGDSFIDRNAIDQRVITRENSFATTANRVLHRARISGQQAVQLLRQYAPTAPGWQVAEMYFVQAYVENLMSESYCSGLVFSDVGSGDPQYGAPVTTVAALTRALAHADSGLALITGTTTSDNTVRYALQLTRARILLNLNRPADAATAVTGVPTTFRYTMQHSLTTRVNSVWNLNNSARRYSLSGGEGSYGPNFAVANDPRVPACVGGSAACIAAGTTQPRTFDNTTLIPMYAQLLWPTQESPVVILSGVEARLVEAEAQLRASNAAGALATLNALRASTGTGSGGVAGLAPLTDAGSDAARVDQLFRERAFWLFGRGTRLGDLRRLIRQYGRTQDQVFPTGAYHQGGQYGRDINFPIPQAEDNNPSVGSGCIDRNA